MLNNTTIVWTNVTWNPTTGCEKVSEGCRHCYAETLAERKRGTPGFPVGFDLQVRDHKLRDPLKKKQPSLVFVNSMSDLFWEAIDDDYRDRVLDTIEAAHWHEFQVLTKRPENLLRYSKRRRLPPNFWAGVTIEAGRLAGRADILRRVETEVRFVSAEPLLDGLDELELDGLDWLITGGESGSHLMDKLVAARRGLVERGPRGRRVTWEPTSRALAMVRTLRDRCQAAGVPFLHKQWGGPRPDSAGRELDGRVWDEYPRLPRGNGQETHG